MKKLQVLFMALLVVSTTTFYSCKKDYKDKPKPAEVKGKITGSVIDAVSFKPVAGAKVTLTNGTKTVDVTVGVTGTFEFLSLENGTYSLTVSAVGYKPSGASGIEIKDGESYVALLPVDVNITAAVGGIFGTVTDADNKPIANADVAISATTESLTNGYFSTAKTNDKGQYFIGAIPLKSSSGSVIPDFKVRFIKSGYKAKVVSEVKLTENMTVNVSAMLVVSQGVKQIYAENFEGGKKDLGFTGFWHIQENATIKNAAFPGTAVLAPNDDSQGLIPAAVEGIHYAWYGDMAKGNFVGNGSNSGLLTSGVIDLTNEPVASLTFKTWWEIESVNPNASGFDIMEIIATDITTNEKFMLTKLNPFQDPILDNRAFLPYTSAGFNKAPIWTSQDFDLSKLSGRKIKLTFSFDTEDSLYNYFRGWMVDDIIVTDQPSTNVPVVTVFKGEKIQRTKRKPMIF